MTRHHMIDGVKVDFTPEEETAQDAVEAAIEEARPLTEWFSDMKRSDIDVSRVMEDIYSGVDPALVPEITRDKIAAKKALRAERPGS